MLKQFGISLGTLITSLIPTERLLKLLTRVGRLILATIIGNLAFIMLMLFFAVKTQGVHAASSALPLMANTLTVTHSTSTTHQMRVFGNGQITDRFLTDNGRNQIDQDGVNPDATTLAIVFDRHLGTTVDVGYDNDFEVTTPITLNDPSLIVPYSEDSYTVYRSKTLSYQVFQQTFTQDTINSDHNWLEMRLRLRNTGDDILRDGKLLFMVDIDVGLVAESDEGGYNPDFNMVYQLDEHDAIAYATGVILLKGDWGGGGIDGTTYPSTDVEKLNQMMNPLNSIIDGENNVSWVVVNIPDLDPGDETMISFGICSETADKLTNALSELYGCVNEIPPPPGKLRIEKYGPTTAFVGETIPFSFTVSSAPDADGEPPGPIENISVYDSLAGPATYVSGNNGDNKLDPTETWIFSASYYVNKDVIDPLPNKATVTGYGTDPAYAYHSTDIEFKPALDVDLSGPDEIGMGNTELFTITVTNDDIRGDGSTISDISITFSEDNADDSDSSDDCEETVPILKEGEIWNCTFSRTIESKALSLQGNATGLDRDGDVLSDTDTLTYKNTDLYLPVIMKRFVQAPDLIVANVNPTSNDIEVIIKNMGNTWVTNRFWVDAYINPTSPPTSVNQIWSDLGGSGLAWNVTAFIAPGGTLTLSVNDTYYEPGFSHFPSPLPPGTVIYVQVDSTALDGNPTQYGAVQEVHEIIDGTYNNIAGPVLSTLSTSGVKVAPPLSDEELPSADRSLSRRP